MVKVLVKKWESRLDNAAALVWLYTSNFRMNASHL